MDSGCQGGSASAAGSPVELPAVRVPLLALRWFGTPEELELVRLGVSSQAVAKWST